MNPKSSKNKGNLLENFVVERLHVTKLDSRAYRQKGSGCGLNKGDVWNALKLCIECKNVKKISGAWFSQVKRETMPYEQPVIVWHRDKTSLANSIVMIEWDHFEKLLVKSREPKMANPDQQLKRKLNLLRTKSNILLKELEDTSPQDRLTQWKIKDFKTLISDILSEL